MPPGVAVTGLESDGGDLFFCGGGNSGKVRAVRRPKRDSATSSSSKISSTPRGSAHPPRKKTIESLVLYDGRPSRQPTNISIVPHAVSVPAFPCRVSSC